MKWYAHDPSAALAGMIGLSVEERGAYYTLMDLQYARAPHGDVTDGLVIKALGVRPQVWRRLKGSLMAKGKVHETDGKLTANRVAAELVLAANRGANSGQTPPITPRKLGVNPPDNVVVSETKSAKTNGLDGIRARATTTTTTTGGPAPPQAEGGAPLGDCGTSAREAPRSFATAPDEGALTRSAARSPDPDKPQPEDLAERRRRVQQELAEMTDAEVTEWCKQTRGPDGTDHGEKLRSANGGPRPKNGLGG